MASIGSITEASSVAEFLKGSDTDDVVSKIEGGKISTLEESFKNKLFEEEKKGLSLEALSIGGRAPLNEISVELRARLDISIDDIENIKTLAKARGYEHTKGEAEKFLKEVLKKYKELCEAAEQDLKSYGNATYTKHYTEKNSAGESEDKTKTIHCSHSITLKYEINGEGTTKITMSGSKDSDSKFDGDYAKFESAFKEAESYYDGKVKEAIDFSKEASKLTPPGVAGIPIATTNDAKRPEGVQPDAKVTEEEIDGEGNGYRTYKNPDGSTTKVTYKHGVPSDTKVTNRYGYTTETIKYDEKGNVTHKNVWTYHKVDGKDHVYESEYTRYEKDENGEWKAVGEAKHYGYSYPDQEGNIKNIRGDEEPDASDVGTPKSAPGSMNYEYSSTSDAKLPKGVQDGAKVVKEELDSVGDGYKEYENPDGTTTKVTYKHGIASSTVDTDKEQETEIETVTDASITSTIKDKKDFILPKGSTIVEDRKGLLNQKFYNGKDDTYFEYDKDDNVYYAKNSDGKYIDSLGIEREKSELKQQKEYLDVDNYLKGSKQSPIYDPEFTFSNNSRADIKNEE